jgi:hypothetical protein
MTITKEQAERARSKLQRIATQWAHVSVQQEALAHSDTIYKFIEQASTAPTPLTDERAAFEAWAKDQGFPLGGLDLADGESYLDLRTQGPWDAWQARALLQAAPQAASQAKYTDADMLKSHADGYALGLRQLDRPGAPQAAVSIEQHTKSYSEGFTSGKAFGLALAATQPQPAGEPKQGGTAGVTGTDGGGDAPR